MQKRKVIQIAVAPDGKIIALCDDGTIWIKKSEWFNIIDVPSDEDEDPRAQKTGFAADFDNRLNVFVRKTTG